MSSLRGQQRREFPQSVRKLAFARCCQQCPEGVDNVPGEPQCESCGLILVSGNIIYEHVAPDGLGGAPILENCKVFCRKICATKKTVEEDNPIMAKADAVLKATYGLQRTRKKIQSAPFPKSAPQRTASRPIERRS